MGLVQCKNGGSLYDADDVTGAGYDDESDDTPSAGPIGTPPSTAKPMAGPAQNGTGRRGATIVGKPASGIILGN